MRQPGLVLDFLGLSHGVMSWQPGLLRWLSEKQNEAYDIRTLTADTDFARNRSPQNRPAPESDTGPCPNWVAVKEFNLKYSYYGYTADEDGFWILVTFIKFLNSNPSKELQRAPQRSQSLAR